MLDFSIAKEDNVSIVYLSGELNALNAGNVSKLLIDLVNEGSYQIILEVSELTYITSNGLRPLLEWLEVTKNASGNRRLAVCNMPEFVKTVFEITGFDRKFPTFDNTESALNTF